MKHFFYFVLILIYPFPCISQTSLNAADISVMTSSDYTPQGWNESASGIKTINGNGFEGKLDEASRFLLQAAFGGNLQMIKEVAETGIEPWIDYQMSLPPHLMLPVVDSIFVEYQTIFPKKKKKQQKKNREAPERPNSKVWSIAWWENYMHSNDVLRQRTAFALSEIFVVSNQSKLRKYGWGTASYYDIFLKNAFGNFRDILSEVTYHPVMGFYLTHLSNPKADPEHNIHPDENYAREVMQLFTIGLFELNQDGSLKHDENGNPIPTYNNDDITEFAKVFTGLGFGAVIENDVISKPRFKMGLKYADMTVPMKMYQWQHEPGEKHLLNGYVIPAGQNGIKDIDETLDLLFNHPNVGPFIGKKLIQLLVKSNPSPEYIAAVAAAFNDNGKGERGDMKAVIKAILLNPEARSCDQMGDPGQGKLLEPFVRYVHFTTAIGVTSPSGKYWNDGRAVYNNLKQYPLQSPTVFNFFLPDFQPIGPIADAGLVAPEFQINNTQTSISYLNFINKMAVNEMNYRNINHPELNIYTDYEWLKEDAQDSEVLLNKLDLLFTHGTLSSETREIIKTAVDEYNNVNDRIHLATYLIMISPDYVILK
jgi:uncharacterized protein (DUF1800 family)